MKWRHDIIVVAMAVAASCLAGCSKPVEPPMTINYYLRSQEDLAAIHTVAFLELSEDAPTQGFAKEMTEALASAMRNKRLFNMDVVGQGESVYRLMPIRAAKESLSLQDLSAMRAALGCDAVLFGVVTSFAPYPHMEVGLRLRLVDLRKGELIWGVDQVWVAADRVVQIRMSRYFERQLGPDYEPLNWRMATVSPKAFENFVAFETAATLIPPLPPEAGAETAGERK